MQVNKRLTSIPISWQSKKTLPRETVIIIIIILAFTLYTIVQKIPSCRERRKEEKRIGIDRESERLRLVPACRFLEKA